MANTTNLDLVKPAGTDKALVSVLNANSDKIDAFAGTTNQALATLNSKILFNRIWRVTITGTTDLNGNLALPQDLGADLILFSWNDSRVFIPFRYNQRWYLRVQLTDLSGSGLAETSVTVYVMCANITYETT